MSDIICYKFSVIESINFLLDWLICHDAYSPLATFFFLRNHQNHASTSSTVVYDEAHLAAGSILGIRVLNDPLSFSSPSVFFLNTLI